MPPIHGSCLCGGVKFEIVGPLFVSDKKALSGFRWKNNAPDPKKGSKYRLNLLGM